MKSLLWCGLAVIIIAISAQLSITIPLSQSGIPITGQSLAILTIASIFKPKHTFIIILSYLILGFAGLPVFAEASSGIDKLWGNSGGFLYGFLISGVLLSYLIDKIVDPSFNDILSYTAVATVVLLAIGVLHLSIHLGLASAFQYGFLPFWPGAVIKAIIGSGIAYFVILRFRKSM